MDVSVIKFCQVSFVLFSVKKCCHGYENKSSLLTHSHSPTHALVRQTVFIYSLCCCLVQRMVCLAHFVQEFAERERERMSNQT